MIMEPPSAAHPKITALYEYWRGQAPAHGRLPGRQHIDPVDVPPLLAHITLLDVIGDPPRFRFRLIGEVPRRFGIPARQGSFLDEAPGAAERPEALDELRQIVLSRRPSWYRGRPVLKHDAHVFEIERLFLPLARDGVTVDMLIGLTTFYGARGEEWDGLHSRPPGIAAHGRP